MKTTIAKLSIAVLLLSIIRILTIFVAIRGLSEGDKDTFLILYNLAISLSLISDFGMRTWLYTRISQSDTFAVEDAYGYRLVMGGLAAAIFGVLAFLDPASKGVSVLAIVAFAFFCANMQPADTSMQILKGYRKNNLEVKIRLLEGVFLFVIILAVYTFAVSLSTMMIAWVIPSILRALVSYHFANVHVKIKRFQLPSFHSVLKTAREYLTPGIGQFLLTAMSRMPILLASLVYPSVGIAAIAMAIMIAQLVQVISTTGSTYILARAEIPVAESFRKTGLIVGGLLGAAGFLSGLAFLSFALFQPALTYLTGVQAPDLHVARICLLSCGPIFVIDVCRLFLSAHEKFRSQVLISASSIAFFIILLILGDRNDVESISIYFVTSVFGASLAFLLQSIRAVRFIR